jgi:hypothetical protein
VRRRSFLPTLLFCFAPLYGSDPAPGSLRGKLIAGPAIRTNDGRIIALKGDAPTMLVLNDDRLKGADFEVVGHVSGPEEFTVDPIHKKALFAYKDGKRLMVSYWCDICYIRTWSPGKCVCCQKYTDLDLIDPDTVDKK